MRFNLNYGIAISSLRGMTYGVTKGRIRAMRGTFRNLVATAAILAACACADEAFGAGTITLSGVQTALPNIGNVVETSPATSGTFRVDAASGSVTEISGTLTRTTGSSVTTPSFTVTCTNGTGTPNHCGPKGGPSTVTITVNSPVSATSATIAGFNVSVSALNGTSCPTITGQNTTSVAIACNIPDIAANNAVTNIATVKVGMDITVSSASPSGVRQPSYTISTSP